MDHISNAALYEQVGEKGNEMENRDFEKKKVDELQKRLTNAHASVHHLELVSLYVPLTFNQYFPTPCRP